MSTLDHPAAHEYLADLALEPRRLAELGTSQAPADVALREHLDLCPTCRAEAGAWAQVQAALASALAASTDAGERAALPPDLRPQLLAAARAGEKAGPPGATPAPARPRPWWPAGEPVRRLVAAAVAGVVVLALLGGAWVIRDQQARLEVAALEKDALVELAEVLGDIVTTSDHEVVTLLAADGAAAGTLAWTRHSMVVLSDALGEPGASHLYRCWVVRNGDATLVGRLYFAGGWAYWAGSTNRWAAIDLASSGRFIVSLEAIGNPPAQPAGPVVLHADLGA